MTEPTEVQTILHEGKPAFVVLPIEDYRALTAGHPEMRTTLPQEVVRKNVLEGMSLLKAWRTWAGLGQAELAARARATQGQIANFENGKSIPRADTLLRLSSALGVSADLLWESDEA